MTSHLPHLSVLMLLGCTAIIGEPLGEDPERPTVPNADGPAPLEAVECVEGTLPSADLRRIDRGTYVAALHDAFGPELIEAVSSPLNGLPTTQDGQYGSELADPSRAEVGAYVDVATAIAFEATKDDESLAALHPCLPSLVSSDEPCFREFVGSLGAQLTRRPLSDDDHARFLDAYSVGGVDTAADGIATTLMAMLLDPRFLYFFEIDGEPDANGVVRLTSHEQAARLARVMWHSVPDAELRAAADAGFDDASLLEQVERMWEDPRSRAAMGEFYMNWLEVSEDDSEALEELLAFTDVMTFEREGTLADLLMDTTAFITSAPIARRYGLDEDVRGEVTLPADQRAGVLTRLGWLATIDVPNSNAGHIIQRGERLGHFVCDPLPEPDPGLLPENDPAQPSGATVGIRERFWEVTSEPQCTGCHATRRLRWGFRALWFRGRLDRDGNP